MRLLHSKGARCVSPLVPIPPPLPPASFSTCSCCARAVVSLPSIYRAPPVKLSWIAGVNRRLLLAVLWQGGESPEAVLSLRYTSIAFVVHHHCVLHCSNGSNRPAPTVFGTRDSFLNHECPHCSGCTCRTTRIVGVLGTARASSSSRSSGRFSGPPNPKAPSYY